MAPAAVAEHFILEAHLQGQGIQLHLGAVRLHPRDLLTPAPRPQDRPLDPRTPALRRQDRPVVEEPHTRQVRRVPRARPHRPAAIPSKFGS